MIKRRPTGSDKYTVHNKVKMIRGGADYFAAIEEIADSAQYSLHLQTYIFDSDETGMKVVEALVRAAARKVLVYVLLDAYASQHLAEDVIARMRQSGVHLAFFAPIFKGNFFYMGRRLHHKLIVADGHKCMVAGINVSNRYNDIGDTKAWLDWAVYAEGEVARGINNVCVSVWDRSVLRKKCRARKLPRQQLPPEQCEVRIRRNDWVYKRIDITSSYRQMFQYAERDVIVMTSYFWPPEKLLKRMIAAARRGVKVRLILTAKADVPFAKYTERYLYSRLFRNNIEVYEYQANVLHGKVAVCDGEWVTAGSYNVNNISAFASVELNLDINNTAIAATVTKQFEDIIANDCVQVTEVSFSSNNNLLQRFVYYLAYRFIHMMFYLFTFYFTQKREPIAESS